MLAWSVNTYCYNHYASTALIVCSFAFALTNAMAKSEGLAATTSAKMSSHVILFMLILIFNWTFLRVVSQLR